MMLVQLSDPIPYKEQFEIQSSVTSPYRIALFNTEKEAQAFIDNPVGPYYIEILVERRKTPKHESVEMWGRMNVAEHEPYTFATIEDAEEMLNIIYPDHMRELRLGATNNVVRIVHTSVYDNAQ